MIRSRRSAAHALALAVATATVATACSLDPYGRKDKVDVHFEYREGLPRPATLIDLDRLQRGDAVGALFYDPPPALSSGFTCMAVNVVGNGIADTSKNGDESAQRLPGLYAGSSCSYAGVTTPPLSITDGQSATLTVPAGVGRIVTVLGLQDPDNLYCGTATPIGDQDHQGAETTKFVELGRAVVDLFSSTGVTVLNTYDSLTASQKRNRLANCGDSTRPSETAGGPIAWYEAGSYVGRSGFSEPTYGGSFAFPASGNDFQDSRGTSGYGPSLVANDSTSNSLLRLASSSLNGQFAVSSGATGYFTGTSALGSVSGFTMVMVARLTIGGGDTLIEVGNNPQSCTSADEGFALYSSSSWGFKACKGVTDNDSGTYGTADTSFHAHTIRWSSGGNVQYWLGVGGSTSSPSTTAGPFIPSLVSLNGSIKVAGSGDVETAEVILWNSALSDSDLSRIWEYLKFKYGSI